MCSSYVWNTSHLTLYVIGLQIEVQQRGRDGGNAGQFVMRQVQFNQGGDVESPRFDFATFQTALTQT